MGYWRCNNPKKGSLHGWLYPLNIPGTSQYPLDLEENQRRYTGRYGLFVEYVRASEYGKIEAGLLTWKDDQASVCDLLDITWDQLDQPLTEYNHNHRDRAMGEVL